MPSTASASDIHRRHEQRLARQQEQLTANSMPQKHDSQRSRQRMNEIQAYAEELREQEAIAFSMSEVGDHVISGFSSLPQYGLKMS